MVTYPARQSEHEPRSNVGSSAVDQDVLRKTAKRCAERGVVVPTFSQLKDPSTIPASVSSKLAKVGMNEIDPVNLFRITWKNQPVAKGGGYNQGNWVEFPPE